MISNHDMHILPIGMYKEPIERIKSGTAHIFGLFLEGGAPIGWSCGVGAESVFSCIACVRRPPTQEALQAFQNNSLLEESSMPASASS